MRDKQHSIVQAQPEVLQIHDHLLAGQGVERTKRLIHQKQAWFLDDGTADRDALSHATGKLGRETFAETAEADLNKQRFGPIAISFDRQAFDFERQQYVVDHVAPRQQIIVLKDHARARIGTVERLVIDENGSLRWSLNTGDHGQKRAFSTPARADDRNELALRDRQAGALQRDDFALVTHFEYFLDLIDAYADARAGRSKQIETS